MTRVTGWTGRFFEDFMEGDVYESRLGRTMLAADNVWFTLGTNNTNQVHFNAEYARSVGLKDCLINSALTLAVVAGLSVTDVSENGINLGWESIDLPTPVFPGDTLYARSRVLSLRASKSRPNMGIVKVETEGLNQDGECVVRYIRSILTWKRLHSPAAGAFPDAPATARQRLTLDSDTPAHVQHNERGQNR